MPPSEVGALAEKETASGLPTAPPPRMKKTVAEMIIGKWRVVEENGRKIQDDWNVYFKFHENVLIDIHVDCKNGRVADVSGLYLISDTVLSITSPVDDDGNPIRTRYMNIEEINDKEILTTLGVRRIHSPKRWRRVLEGE